MKIPALLSTENSWFEIYATPAHFVLAKYQGPFILAVVHAATHPEGLLRFCDVGDFSFRTCVWGRAGQ
jgi:hypothetical protein